jgi:hypothetical protein
MPFAQSHIGRLSGTDVEQPLPDGLGASIAADYFASKRLIESVVAERTD